MRPSLLQINNLFGWTFIGITSWRMRSAWVKQGKPLTALKAPNLAGRWGAPIVVVSFIFIILIQGWSSFKGGFQAKKFVQSYRAFWSFSATFPFFPLSPFSSPFRSYSLLSPSDTSRIVIRTFSLAIRDLLRP
jgi:amino acid permease